MKKEYTTIQVKKVIHAQFMEISRKTDVRLRVLTNKALVGFLENQKEYQKGGK